MAMGNSLGMVIKVSIESIDAAKYLTVMRYEFNDYRKLENHVYRNIEITSVRWFENKVG